MSCLSEELRRFFVVSRFYLATPYPSLKWALSFARRTTYGTALVTGLRLSESPILHTCFLYRACSHPMPDCGGYASS
ncbi:predicted protein [Plenodomus lingam JN3]|uniref:Predicted protein n=1 Tax=Leptosphaeria maculans (strain JN3 / isolate v23.1.3 / race Av1-4-5-6-7-8) TaxID=985895 RepID=E5AFE4_LEPMJ|nr:predicted protein [Plenodomus lingam JN3]CBY01933.1 predicted protein [Plenodomus lingam JN3]